MRGTGTGRLLGYSGYITSTSLLRPAPVATGSSPTGTSPQARATVTTVTSATGPQAQATRGGGVTGRKPE